MRSVRCWIVRGGTSKGLFVLKNHLPQNPRERDRVLLAMMGSPDERQIDGLGGADSLTSKLAIVGPPTITDADVDYTFGQASITESFIDYGGNCGNISSAVGPFALHAGLVAAATPSGEDLSAPCVTTVRIHMTNTGRILTAKVPTVDGAPMVEGDYAIDGVPGTGAKITLDFSKAVGGCTGNLLPTGRATDTMEIDGALYEVSIVDAGNVVVFIRAESLGLKGTESAAEIDGDSKLLGLIEKIRGYACVKIGLVDSWEEAAVKTPFQPFFAIVSKPAPYTGLNNINVSQSDVDIVSRLLFMQKMHKAYPITGTVCTGAASRVSGSIVWQMLSDEARQSHHAVRIGHPCGVLPVVSEYETEGKTLKLTNIEAYRTARVIMEGYTYVRKSVFDNP